MQDDNQAAQKSEEKKTSPSSDRKETGPDSPIVKLLKESVHYSKKQDDLLDVHIGNPLRRITQLLEQIKKQKAFTFTFKGSLGVMGVVLVFGTFGIFGGEKLLCNKGVQSKIGHIKILQSTDPESSSIPLFGGFVDWYKTFIGYRQLHPRVVLIQENENVVTIAYSREVDPTVYNGQIVITTGDFDSCSQTLKPQANFGIELLQ